MIFQLFDTVSTIDYPKLKKNCYLATNSSHQESSIEKSAPVSRLKKNDQSNPGDFYSLHLTLKVLTPSELKAYEGTRKSRDGIKKKGSFFARAKDLGAFPQSNVVSKAWLISRGAKQVFNGLYDLRLRGWTMCKRVHPTNKYGARGFFLKTL